LIIRTHRRKKKEENLGSKNRTGRPKKGVKKKKGEELNAFVDTKELKKLLGRFLKR